MELLSATENRVTVMCAFSKNPSSMLYIFCNNKIPLISAVYPVSAEHRRLVKVSDLSKQMNAIDDKLFKQPVGSIKETLEHVVKVRKGETILICGSFFIMSEVR